MIKKLQEKIKEKYGDRIKKTSRHKLMTIIASCTGEIARCALTGDTKSYDHNFGEAITYIIALAIKMDIDLEEYIEQFIERELRKDGD